MLGIYYKSCEKVLLNHALVLLPRGYLGNAGTRWNALHRLLWTPQSWVELNQPFATTLPPQEMNEHKHILTTAEMTQL